LIRHVPSVMIILSEKRADWHDVRAHVALAPESVVLLQHRRRGGAVCGHGLQAATPHCATTSRAGGGEAGSDACTIRGRAKRPAWGSSSGVEMGNWITRISVFMLSIEHLRRQRAASVESGPKRAGREELTNSVGWACPWAPLPLLIDRSKRLTIPSLPPSTSTGSGPISTIGATAWTALIVTTRT
jgi:hypothetical protein